MFLYYIALFLFFIAFLCNFFMFVIFHKYVIFYKYVNFTCMRILYICVFIYFYIYAFIYICIFIYMYMRFYMYAFLYICVLHVHVYVFTYNYYRLLDLSTHAFCASIMLLLNPLSSKTRTASIVVPAGEQTISFNSPGCMPVSNTIFALPNTA